MDTTLSLVGQAAQHAIHGVGLCMAACAQVSFAKKSKKQPLV